ncbi:MAG: DUF1127 domain-containing protein [Ramlibacter sp.]
MNLKSLIEGLRAALSRHRRRKRLRLAVQDLRLMSDHVLRDMGIGRSEIQHITRMGRGVPPADLQRQPPTAARTRVRLRAGAPRP